MTKKLILTLMVAALALMVAGCGDDSGRMTPINGPARLLGAAIPEGAVITSATLGIYIIQNSNQTVNSHRITDDWTEMGVTWNSFGGAFDAAVEGAFTVDGEGWRYSDATSLVQDWIDGVYPNYGFLLEQGTTFPRSIFYAREYSVIQPTLEVCYMTPDGIECETFTPMADAYIWELNPDDNVGGRDILYTGWEQATDFTKYSLIRFDLPTEPPPPPPDGCTRTIGFWKTHAGFGPQDDEVTQYLPITLGDDGGAKSRLVADAQDAVDYLSMDVYGRANNGITKLYAQLLGAKLNLASGATSAVDADIAAADAFLADYDWNDWKTIGKDNQKMVLGWMETLDDYNNGYLGTLHCD